LTTPEVGPRDILGITKSYTKQIQTTRKSSLSPLSSFRWGYYFGGAHTTGSAGLVDPGGVIYSSSAGGSYDSFIGQRIPLPEVNSGYASMLEKPVAEVQRAIKQRLGASGRFSTAKLRYSTLVIGDAFTSTFSAGFWTPLADDVARQEAYLGLSNTWTATFTRLSANTAADAAMILATAGAGKGVSATRAGVALKAAWAGKAGWAGLAATRGTAIGLSSAGVVLGGIGVYNGVGQMADGNKYGLLSIARGAEAMIGGGLGMYYSTRGLGAAMRNVRAAPKNAMSRGAQLRAKYGHMTAAQRQARMQELLTGNRVLREAGVPKQYISEALQSFEPGTITTRIAGEADFGLRFYGGVSGPKSPYLSPTFPGGNVRSLNAVPGGNTLQYIKQWQIRPGTPILEGRIRPAFGQPGGGRQIYVPDFHNNLIGG
ncbi:MAG: hypothetical protein GVY36_18510, partial [Verrucomicrobia bacterium]|nr:hypothetical protein [Verrucomicrobiota bacterium]